MSRYEWSQEQRRIETAVRMQKDVATVAKASGDMKAVRAAYYNYYTNKEWGVASSYNFSIDVSVLGVDETVAFIKNFVERKRGIKPPHFG